MARGTVYIDVKINSKAIDLVTELVTEMNELVDLIPEWNHLEAKESADKISEILSKILDFNKSKYRTW